MRLCHGAPQQQLRKLGFVGRRQLRSRLSHDCIFVSSYRTADCILL